LIDSFFVKELIILTPRGTPRGVIDFTTIPVSESWVLKIMSQRLRYNINQVICTTLNPDWDNHLQEMIN